MMQISAQPRIPCCVPYCRRSTKEGLSDWVCGKHWAGVSRAMKAKYTAEKRQARKIIARKPLYREWWKYPSGSSDRLAAVAMWRRLDAIWDQCRAEAIERAMGI